MKMFEVDRVQAVMKELISGTVAEKRWAYNNVLKALKGLPQIEVVQCWDCDRYDRMNEFCSFWCQHRHPEHFCDEGLPVLRKEDDVEQRGRTDE